MTDFHSSFETEKEYFIKYDYVNNCWVANTNMYGSGIGQTPEQAISDLLGNVSGLENTILDKFN